MNGHFRTLSTDRLTAKSTFYVQRLFDFIRGKEITLVNPLLQFHLIIAHNLKSDKNVVTEARHDKISHFQFPAERILADQADEVDFKEPSIKRLFRRMFAACSVYISLATSHLLHATFKTESESRD